MPLTPDVRPEVQKINPNRTDLNIEQPGEQPFDYHAYLDTLTPGNVKDYRTSANLKDYGIAVTSGAANLPEGVGALANFGGQWLEKKAGELSPDHFVVKSALSDIGGFLHKGGQAVQKGVSDWKQDLESGYSEQAKNALEQGATGSIAGLTLNLANVFGDLGAMALTGGLEGIAAKGVTSALLRREAVSGLIRKGLTKEAAEKVADDAMEIAARKTAATQTGKTASKYGFIASGTADAQGNTAAAAAQGVLNASPQELASSPTFVNLYQSVQSDPQYAHLSDADKVQVAKEQLANRVGMSVATDPKLLAVNIGSTMMGDKAVADMVLNGVSKSIVGGFTKGALREGALNGLQSGYSQYAQNVARDEDAGIATDHMQGVAHATGDGALLGGILGGGAGIVSGVRGRNSKPDTQRTDAAREAFDAKAQRAREMAQDSPYTKPADPVESYRRQFSGLTREELLQHYADADLAPENDVDAVYRKHASNGLLKEMDRADQLKDIVDEMQGKPRNEVLAEYRELNEKDKRNATEQMRWEAAREVLRPQPKASTGKPQSAEVPQGQGISVPTVRFGDDVPHIEITQGAPRPPERIEKVRSDNNYFSDARSAKNSDVFRNAEQTGLKPEIVKKGDRQYAVEMDNPQVSEDRARGVINTLAMGERIPDKPKTIDPMEIPAFMRDPRFRDFTDESTEVQQHLTRRNAPTPEELVHEQMAKGDAGPTDFELAERPRLPSPGDIHPGQGYPMPGEVRHMSDEPPAGRGGRYTTTGEAQGQSYGKVLQSTSPEGGQRQGETFRGEQSYRDLPAPERQGGPRTEAVEPDRGETVNTEQDIMPEASEGEQNASQPEVQEPVKTEPPRAATEKSGEKIDDFGEVIHGAAKHRRVALSEELNTDKTAEDYRIQPLSKLFPKPDYEKMAAEGTDNNTLAVLALLRNMIPAKPRVSHRLNHWAKQVEEVRNTAGQLLDGSLPADKFIDRIGQEKGSHYREIVNTWEMLHRLSPAQLEQAAGYRVKTHAYSMFRGKEYNPPKVIHSLENEKGRSVLDSEDLNDLYKKAKVYFDQQSVSPKSAGDKTKLDIYQNRRTGEVFIAYGKNKTSLQGGFKTVTEAREYAKNNRAELLEKLNVLRDQSREEQRNASNRDRNGPVRRGGEMHTEVNALRNISGSGTGYSEKAASLKRKIAARMNTNDAFAFNRLMDSRFADERERGIAIAERVAATLEPEQNVTPEKFSDAFGFRGVQFGNYVEGPRRQSDLNRAYDSLMDMADVLKVPPKALSLNGRLGLAFGARGKGGKNAAAAHYEPGQVAINLTKGNGAGSLAHEWFHALDNYFGQHDVARDGDVVSGDKFMTSNERQPGKWNGKEYSPVEHPVRQEVYDAFKGVMKAINRSGMVDRARRLDEVRSKPYWSTDIEMAARAFERYVQDKAKAAGVDNDFLVNIRKADDHGSPDTYAYPTEAELDGGIRQAFDHLFSTLKTRETDKGVAFYSREANNKSVRTPWPKDFPYVVLHARLGDATSHKDYEAAKSGDKDAAYRLVTDVMTKDAVDKIRKIIGNREVLLAAVHAEEASGRNKIPQAMADVLGRVLHQDVDDSIIQVKRVGRTGQDGFGRLANQPEFAGNVRSDVPYFILDDTLTQGGTLAGLKGYIESHGGRVIGASALTGKQYSARMALSPQTLSQLREHFGGTGLENWWKQQNGYGFDGLTESEANYLLRAGDADKIRDRVLAARQTGDSSILSEAPGDGRPLPPDVKPRYAQKASDNGGFSVIGDGNLLSETGHSAEAPAQASTVRKVKTVARTVMDRIRDIDLNVRVVKSQAEAAELAGESLDKHGKVHAFYRPDEHEIVLVADNLSDGRTVREKLRHEIIHHALESVVTPAEYKTIVDNVLKTRDSNNATIKDIWRKVDASYGEESPQVQAGEFLAHMAEKHTPGKLGAAWNRIVSLVKAVLRRTGLLQPSDLNDIGYIRDTIRTLGQRVREGYVPRDGGDVSYSRTGESDPFKVPEGEGERYRKDLAKMMKSLRSADMTVDIGRTPPVLRHIGAPDLPLVISRDVIRKATNGVKHDVPMDVIERLPELMHDPKAVYQSATEKDAVVMLLDAVDKNNEPVITAVHMKAVRSRLEINRVASVYGTENGKKIHNMERAGLALYRKKKSSRDNPLHSGLQLPKGEHSYHDYEDNVLSPDDIRKGPYYSHSRSDLSPEETLAARSDPFKVPEGEGERYRRDLAKAVKSHRSSDISITIGRTPPVLRNIGAPDLPLVIYRDTVRKATNGVKHDVPMEVIEQLPELIHDPEAVYQSATEKNAVVMLFDAVDKNGDPVIGAVHLKTDKKGLEINKVASVYGAFPSKLSKMDREGLALYKKQNPDNQSAGVLQLHGDSDHQGSVNKILHPDDIRKGPYYSRTTSALSPEETLSARFVRQMQDKFQVLKAVQDNIRKSGGKLDDSNDAYLAEELFHGKAENDLNVMKERYVKPLAKLLAVYDIPQSALDEYLYARHAPERNAHIAKINPKMPDGGSGMTNAEAADIMDKVRRSGKQAQYDRLAGIVDDMLARRRELIRESGLEDDGVIDAWQKTYRHYVPLKGQDEDGAVPRTGRGYVISGKESRMAMGRNSKAQSPSTQAIQDLTGSLIRNRKNVVGNAFLKLVQDNPDNNYWQVFTDDKPDTMRVIVEKTDPTTGDTIRRVEERPVPMAMVSDRYFTTKKDGKTYYIKLHDDRLMRAMKNMGPEMGNVVTRTLDVVNRMMSMMNTSLNPEFLVSNFIRDMQTAVMNLKAEQGRDDGKLSGRDIAMKTVRDSGIAMKAVYASLRGKSLTGRGADWQKTWKEFVEDGAKTGWFRMDDLNGQMKEMNRLVSLAKGGWKGQGIQSWHSFTKLVEDANNAVENALRLSAYKHAREAGISRAQAASLAKNMTVNFNRRGEQGVLLNSLYMFANASIQGTANMMRSLAHLNGDGPLLQRLRWKNLNMAQKLALTATGAGYLLASLNRAGAGQDEDGVNWYDKVPDYVKEHNLVIMKSLFGGKSGEYWSIPLPYGYNMFYLLGSTMEGVTRGDMTASKAAGNIVGGMLGAFNPLGSEDSQTLTGTLFKNAAPTILRPFADLWANESFMGTPIYQTNFPGSTPKPESSLGRRSTPEAYKAFAGWLNRVSGGSQYRSGVVDINPDIMKYWIDYMSGGMGRFAGKTIDAAAKTYNGIDIPAQQVPFLGKLSGQVMPYADQQKMYDHIDELRQYNAELKALHGADRTAFRNKYRGQLSMNGIIHQSEIQLKNLRKQRDEVYSDPALTARQQADRVLMIEQNMKKVVDRFNREYREKVGD